MLIVMLTACCWLNEMSIAFGIAMEVTDLFSIAFILCWTKDMRWCDFIGLNLNLILKCKLHLHFIDIHMTAGVDPPISVVNIFNHFLLSVSTAAGCVPLRRNAARRSISLHQNTLFVHIMCDMMLFCVNISVCMQWNRKNQIYLLFLFHGHIWRLDWLLSRQPRFNPLAAEFYSLVIIIKIKVW